MPRSWYLPVVLLALALAAASALEPRPLADSLFGAGVGGALIAATIWLTRPAPTLPAPAPLAPYAAQLLCLGGFYVFHLLGTAHSYQLLHLEAFAQIDAIDAWLDARIGNSNWVMNPLLGGILPAVAVLALGARPAEIGLGRGRFLTRTTLLWCAVPLAYFVVPLATGSITFVWLGFHLIDAALQASIGEELFDRGLIQSRLERFGPAWAIVGSAIFFGLGHIPARLHDGAPDLLAAAARCLVDQTMMGLVFAVLFWRTRSLLPGILLHTVFNTGVQLPPG